MTPGHGRGSMEPMDTGDELLRSIEIEADVADHDEDEFVLKVRCLDCGWFMSTEDYLRFTTVAMVATGPGHRDQHEQYMSAPLSERVAGLSLLDRKPGLRAEVLDVLRDVENVKRADDGD